MYRVDQVYFHVLPKVNTTFYRVNGLWKLVDTTANQSEEDGFARAHFFIYIKRKAEYFLTTLLLPCVLLSALMCLVFLLPAESNEKITLQVTVVLSFVVFQLVITTNMPQTSDFVPLICK